MGHYVNSKLAIWRVLPITGIIKCDLIVPDLQISVVSRHSAVRNESITYVPQRIHESRSEIGTRCELNRKHVLSDVMDVESVITASIMETGYTCFVLFQFRVITDRLQCRYNFIKKRQARVRILCTLCLILHTCYWISWYNGFHFCFTCRNKKLKISLLQAVEAHRVARGRGSHIS
jgi:hypothetical protein